MQKPEKHSVDSRWAMAAVCASILPYSTMLPSFMQAKEVGLSVITALLLLRAIVLGRAQVSIRLLWPLVLLLAYGLIVRLWRESLPPSIALYDSALRATLVICAAIAFGTLERHAARRGLIQAVAYSALILAVLMPFQYYGVIPWLFPVFPSYGQPMYSVFGNQAILGGFLAIGFAAWRFVPAVSRGAHILRWGASLAVAVGVIATGSSSAWIALGVAALVGGLARAESTSWWNLTSGVAIAIACVALITKSIELGAVDSGLRIWFWQGSLAMIQEFPFFGGGIGTFALRSPLALGGVLHAPGGDSLVANGVHTLHAHNDYIEFFTETGIIGLIAITIFLWCCVRRCTPSLWFLIAPMAAFAMLTPFFVHAPFAALALCCVVAHRQDDDRDPAPIDRLSNGIVALCLVFVAGMLSYGAWIPGWHLQQARAIHMAGGDARPAYEGIMDTPNLLPEAARDYGSYLLGQGDYEEALSAYQRAEAMGLRSTDVYKGLAMAAFLSGSEFEDETIRAIDAYIARWPRGVEPWAIRIAMGQPADAVREEAAPHITEDDWSAVVALAQTFSDRRN